MENLERGGHAARDVSKALSEASGTKHGGSLVQDGCVVGGGK